jgi:hypothetical protein
LKNSIENLRNKFIITYVDKVSGNFAFVCKQFYFEYIKNFIHNSNNYKLCNNSQTEINNKIKALHKRLGLNINKINLPYIFITPKFHKNPIKFRTVTCGYNTYIVKTSQVLKNIVQTAIDSLNGSSIINNSYKVIEYMKDKIVNSVYTYDFEDLFNSIDIEDMITVLNKMYDEMLSNIIQYEKFKILINVVLKENYIEFDGKIYRQCMGLAQGGSASNCLANIYLHYYEKNRANIQNCNDSYLLRYIDDVIVFGGSADFVPNVQFYPNYLKLKLTNLNSNKADFLDLEIEIVDNSIKTKIFDKRNSFNFKVNKFPNWLSNIHKSVFKGVIITHIYRNKNLISNNWDRYMNIKDFIDELLELDYPIDFVFSYINKNKFCA